MRHLLTLAIQHDQDVVTARHRAAFVGQLLGFDTSEQTRVATAVSEIVRNGFRYAKGASVTFAVDEEAKPQRLIVRVTDEVRASRTWTTCSPGDINPGPAWAWASSEPAG